MGGRRLVLLGSAALAPIGASCTHDFDEFTTVGDAATDATSAKDAGGDGAADASDAAPSCGDAGEVAFGGHCYFKAPAQGTWNGSLAACAATGHLVTITSAAEQGAAVQVAAGNDRWIGLTRAADAGATDPSSFGWVTGETVTYVNWKAGEPNGSGPCVRMEADGTWGDQVCANPLDAICEID